jgi:hypothetical protein
VTLSDSMTVEQFVFIPAEQTRVEFVPGASDTTLPMPANAKSKVMPGGYRMYWHRPG